jgi:dsDNA-specific endonuclease/ATPase MutS2
VLGPSSGTLNGLTDEESVEPVAVLEIEDSIDLHGFQPRDVLSVVEDYLEAAIEKGYAEVRLIHGRGKGVQRARIQALLAQHDRVAHFRDAPAARGGWGATIVTLIVGPLP